MTIPIEKIKAELAKQSRTSYVIFDQDGNLIEVISEAQSGEALLTKIKLIRARRGKIIVAIPCDKPEGYTILCVTDGDSTYYQLLTPDGTLLKEEYVTLEGALRAAVRHAPPENPPSNPKQI